MPTPNRVRDGRGHLEIQTLPDTVKAGEPFHIVVTLFNDSGQDWHTLDQYPLRLAYHWQTPSGENVVYDGCRTELPGGHLAAGAQVEVSMRIDVPATAGRYHLVLLPLQERSAWLDYLGFKPLTIEFEILSQYKDLDAPPAQNNAAKRRIGMTVDSQNCAAIPIEQIFSVKQSKNNTDTITCDSSIAASPLPIVFDGRGHLKIESYPSQVNAGDSFLILAKLFNNSDQDWHTLDKFPLSLSYHWQTLAGETVIQDGLRTALPATQVAPGEQLDVRMHIKAPNKAGCYQLVVLPVQDGSAWFDKLGFVPSSHEITVAPQTRYFSRNQKPRTSNSKLDQIYIHVGLDKTGSTSIQTFMHNNRDVLLKRYQIAYAPENYHARIASFFSETPERITHNVNNPHQKFRILDERYYEILIEYLINSIKNEANKLIISYEGFMQLNYKELSDMIIFLEHWSSNIFFVYYVRPPLSYACSAFSQMAKFGVSTEYKHPVQQHKSHLEKLIALVDKNNILVRHFDRNYLTNGCIVQDFLSLISHSENISTFIKENGFRMLESNKSLTNIAVKTSNEIVRSLYDRKINYSAAEYAAWLSEALESIEGEPVNLTEQQLERISSESTENIEFLRKEFSIDIIEKPESYLCKDSIQNFDEAIKICRMILPCTLRKAAARSQ